MNEIIRGDDTAAASLSGQVDIVTVNWNAGRQLADCIDSVRQHDESVVRCFIVVDNGSRDGSADIGAGWPKLIIDKVGANLGFGRACNRGAAAGNAPFVLFLNPDTRLTEPAISKAVAFLRSEESGHIAVCGIRLIDETGDASRHCARFPTLATFANIATGLDKLAPRFFPGLLMSDFDHQSSRPIDHVQGAFYLIRRKVFEQLGGFDDDYFVYLEDLDLSSRIREAGYGTHYLASASAFHSGGGTSRQVKAIARFYGMEARHLYVRKRLGTLSRHIHAVLIFAVEPPATLVWHLLKYRGSGLRALSDAFVLLFGNARGVLQGRTARARGDRAAREASLPIAGSARTP